MILISVVIAFTFRNIVLHIVCRWPLLNHKQLFAQIHYRLSERIILKSTNMASICSSHFVILQRFWSRSDLHLPLGPVVTQQWLVSLATYRPRFESKPVQSAHNSTSYSSIISVCSVNWYLGKLREGKLTTQVLHLACVSVSKGSPAIGRKGHLVHTPADSVNNIFPSISSSVWYIGTFEVITNSKTYPCGLHCLVLTL